ncbi:MAG: bifunctional adenosylcobinamide kinase/adenosylcobinamide-phosphate guanylyltransferase [Gammaproteobacteria bacterium]|nr:bifunctional adenosylcobinamide kinase/adenosylcobinamide-phosphate guanylyltransferase [Gammaproteobacteria bacterium]
MRTLILGGVRSGKSAHAEALAAATGKPVCYIATADAHHNDAAMAARIAAHQQRRPADWTLLEAPLSLAAALQQAGVASVAQTVLVECSGLWITNLLLADSGEALLQREVAALLHLLALPTTRAEIIIVGNESSFGITPLDPLSRRYADRLGELHQQLAAISERVDLVVAGLVVRLK